MFILIATGIRSFLGDRANVQNGLNTGLGIGLIPAAYSTINGAWETDALALQGLNALWAAVSFSVCGLIVGALAKPRTVRVKAASAVTA